MKERIVRDPIHNFITLTDYEFVQKVVDTEYFQRLRRLSQLGVSSYVYPSATHNRLSHSLGSMELFSKIFDNLHRNENISSEIAEQKKIGIATILLHDMGHGPLSHVSEKIFGFKHEDMTTDIIKNTEIKKILAEDGIDVEIVVKLIKHISPPEQKYVSQLVSSQLDVDRLDYLTRDAYFTGASFGKIDLERIIRTMKIYNGGGDIDGYVISSHKGFEAIESYVLGRHLMYRGVYFHKTTRGIERLIETVFKRAKELLQSGKLTLPKELEFLKNEDNLTINNLNLLDDHVIFYLIKQWIENSDTILSDLSRRIIHRRLLKPIEIQTKQFSTYLSNSDSINTELNKNGFDPNYYLLYDDSTETPYSTYSPKGAEDKTNVITNIFVLNKQGQPEEISELSEVVKTLARAQTFFRIYVPEECRNQTLSILGLNSK